MKYLPLIFAKGQIGNVLFKTNLQSILFNQNAD